MSANIRHSSATNEHYTPLAFVTAAREVMGGIDLDPASSPKANEQIQAKLIYTPENNGFTKPWHGRIFLNPPGGRCDGAGVTVVSLKAPHKGWSCLDEHTPCGHGHANVQSSAKAWWFRLVQEYFEDHVQQAIFVMFSIELMQTSQVEPPLDLPSVLEFPVCVPNRRIAYDHLNDQGARVPSNAPPHASGLVYLAPRGSEVAQAKERFRKRFSMFGITRLT